MRAGRLRHRLTIQTASEAQDTVGELIKTWSSVTTVWGSIEPTTGNESLAGDKIAAEVTHVIRIRSNTNAAAEARFLFGSRIFEIVNVLDTGERSISRQLQCTEVV